MGSAQKQKTIGREGRMKGVGLHTGEAASLTVKPAPVDSGIRFYRDGKLVSDLKGESDLGYSSGSMRCSFLGDEKNRILTVEHLLACFRGLGITNIAVELEGPEVPGMDGSALPFVRFLKDLGIVDQPKAVEFYRVTEPILCSDTAKSIGIYPADEFSIAYTLDYDHPYLRNQKVEFVLDPDTFEREIAPARTFCTEKEVSSLQKNGFGRGANPENTLVVDEAGAHRSRLRFPDECARHKVLDILGDFNLLGFPVLGRIVGLRSGHALNRRLVQAIKAQKGGDMKPLMGVEEIKKVLPHREPFLFVDSIVEMTEKSIVGIKNLTGKEAFFPGHFPGRPVMPGVLMIEALAQTGGVLMLSKPEHRGKIAYLVAVNEARFRKVVSPGDKLRLEVEVLKFKAKVGVVQGIARVGADPVCEAEIMFSLAD